PMSGRIFFDTGIFDGLRERLGSKLAAALVVDDKHSENWAQHFDGLPVMKELELFPWKVPLPEKVVRRADLWLDRQIGFYPAAVRFNLQHGFHTERIRPGHPHLFLNSDLIGPLPRWPPIERAMRKWLHSPRRYVSRTLLERMKRECSAIVLSNVHMLPTMRFILGARRLRIPVVGYIASWDHTVGKGIIPSHFDRYIVQNEMMRDELARYHEVDRSRVVVTGWPQSDVFHRRRPRSDYDALLRGYGLDPARPLVMVMGNTPTNMPHEARFVERMLEWRESLDETRRPSLLFRPHPLDKEWQ